MADTAASLATTSPCPAGPDTDYSLCVWQETSQKDYLKLSTLHFACIICFGDHNDFLSITLAESILT